MRLISSREANVLDGVEVWAGYYRANPQRFAKDYLNVNRDCSRRFCFL